MTWMMLTSTVTSGMGEEEEEEEEEEDVHVEPEKVEPEWKQHMMRDVIETVGGFNYGFDDEHKDTMNSHEN